MDDQNERGAQLLVKLGLEGHKNKRLEETLREEREFISAVLDTADVLVITLDLEGRIMGFNRACEKLTGYTFEEARGQLLWELLLLPEEAASVKAVFQELQSGRFPNRHENYWVAKDGTRRMIAWTNTVLRDKAGSVSKIIGHGIDITERKQREEALRQEKDLLARLMETSPAGITVVNSQGQITFANTQAEKILGLARAEITSRTYNAPGWRSTDYEGNPFPDAQQPFRQVMFSKQPVYDVRQAIEWPDGRATGRRVFLSINGAPLLGQQGQVDRVVFTIQDITEQVKAERALQERTRELARRVKALNCLYGIANLVETPNISLEEILQGVVELIPPAWQYPHITAAKIILNGQIFKTENSEGTDSTWKQTAKIVAYGGTVGSLCVCYLEQKPPADDGPFLEEERQLLKAIAERLGRIIERKRAEDALQRSEERYALAQRAANIGSWEWEIDTNAFHASEQVGSILGFEYGDFPEKYEAFLDSVHPDDRQSVVSTIEACVTKSQDYAIEHRIIWPDGTVHWILQTGNVMHNKRGGPRMFGIVQDITERKQTEFARKRELRSLESLSGAPRASITAEALGVMPLRKAVPDTFGEFVERYSLLMDLALEERAYKVDHNVSEVLRDLAEHVGLLRAGPRDVMEIHVKALKEKSRAVSSLKAQAYADEGRLMVLELMGYLVAYYRNYLMGFGPVVKAHAGAGGDHE